MCGCADALTRMRMWHATLTTPLVLRAGCIMCGTTAGRVVLARTALGATAAMGATTLRTALAGVPVGGAAHGDRRHIGCL